MVEALAEALVEAMAAAMVEAMEVLACKDTVAMDHTTMVDMV